MLIIRAARLAPVQLSPRRRPSAAETRSGGREGRSAMSFGDNLNFNLENQEKRTSLSAADSHSKCAELVSRSQAQRSPRQVCRFIFGRRAADGRYLVNEIPIVRQVRPANGDSR